MAVFHGWAAAGIVGIAEGEGLTQIPLGTDVERYPRHVAKAVEALLTIGISGPYGLALGPDGYTSLVETTEHGGLIVFDHIRQILQGQIVWAPGVKGAVVMSLRGGDFVFEVGRGPFPGLRPSRRRDRSPLPGGELQLPGHHPGGGGGPDAVSGAGGPGGSSGPWCVCACGACGDETRDRASSLQAGPVRESGLRSRGVWIWERSQSTSSSPSTA